MKKRTVNVGFFLIPIIILFLFCIYLEMTKSSSKAYTRVQFLADVAEGNIFQVEIQPNEQTPTGRLDIQFNDGTRTVLYVADVEKMESLLEENQIPVLMNNIPQDSWFRSLAMPILIVVIGIVFVMIIMNNQMNNNHGNRAMNFGKSRARLNVGRLDKITLSDVAGLKEEKEELEEIVDFLREPGKYTRIGARIPKGVLLEGPPGTGKTLLAKAIAGEAEVPFFSISGSDFVEMFVGVGASRVRDLFAEAQKNHPCIVFIDEIDAVARKRGAGMGGSHDEREQTLNQLLVEMDGFGENEGIIVLAATNRVDILDPAILRPGRFDRKIAIGVPDVGGREDILKVHARNKPLADNVDLEQVAQTTAGFTGADLENLLNEAAIMAAKSRREYINTEDIKKAFIKPESERRRKAGSFPGRKERLPHIMRRATLFYIISCRMWDRCIPFPLFPPGRGRQVIPCLCRQRTKCF